MKSWRAKHWVNDSRQEDGLTPIREFEESLLDEVEQLGATLPKSDTASKHKYLKKKEVK